MSRKKRRGRPTKANAKRNTTTREGRRTGRDPIDLGAPLLLKRKRRASGSERTDLPLDGAAVLLGHELIDRIQFDRLGEVTRLLHLVGKAWGQHDGSVTGLWSAIMASLSRAGRVTLTVPLGADGARFALARRLSRLNGSRDLVVSLAEGKIPPLVQRVLLGRVTDRDQATLERLRAGLDAM